MIEEIEWRPVAGFEGYYEVSNTGSVRSLGRVVIMKDGRNKSIKEKILVGKFDKDGYIRIKLCKDCKKIHIGVHRLVAMAFIPNPENKPMPNHLNGNRSDNMVGNLEWATQSENKLHSFAVLGAVAHNRQKIIQYDLEGRLIKEWPSVKHAAKGNNILRRSLSTSIARGTPIFAGYKWKYAS